VERGDQLLGILAAHPRGATAWALSPALFARPLVNPDDQRFALAETLAHLEYLRTEGRVEREMRDGLSLYRAVAGA
jgi:hypothetical protein